MGSTIAKAMLKTALATGAFAALHSLLASRQAKRSAVRAFGQDNADGLYRVAYIAQSLVAGGVLLNYLRRQPSIELFDVRGSAAFAMHAAQIAGLAHATAAARQVGILRITGIENFSAWVSGEPVPPMPEAQGPGFNALPDSRAAGPFALSRHPLNLSPVLILWLWPKMNSTLLAFNISATVYLFVGSLHEERRLLQSDGDDYEAYQTSGVPFYWPKWGRNTAASVRQLSE